MKTILILVVLLGSFSLHAGIDELLSEQKFAEALKLVRESIEKNKPGDEKRTAELIIQEAKIQVALHGYETAVKELKARDWPKAGAPRAMVSLAYARLLQTYHSAYSWEIRKREKIGSRDAFDLKTMTSEEIYLEAYEGLASSWEIREELGKLEAKSLPEIVSPNTYPKEIRGTLRDTLTYLIADFLSDTSGWNPEESSHIPSQLTAKKITLTGSDAHPLEKIFMVLRDLENWHRKEGRSGGALEAKLEFFRKFWPHQKSLTGKEEILKDLRAELRLQNKTPWVSMGQATLADFLRGEDKLPDAHEAATIGAKLNPDSPGGKRCRDILREIESPSLSVQGMNIDGSNRQSLGVEFKNLSKIYLRSVRVDFEDFIKTTRDFSLRPGWRELERYLRGVPEKQWEVTLPLTTDYQAHKKHLSLPPHSHGFYVVFAATNPQFAGGIVTGVEMFVSDYVFETMPEAEAGRIGAKVLRGETGAPVAGAEVNLYEAKYNEGHKKLLEKTTDKKGKSEFSIPQGQGRYQSYFFLVKKDGQLIASQRPGNVGAPQRLEKKVSDAFIYTDRSFYRPGQKVLYKIVAYRGDRESNSYEVDSNQLVDVEFLDANSQVVSKSQVKTNRFGSASGEFSIPAAGKLLGSWSLRTNHGGRTEIKVEEYKRPTFLVEFQETGNELRLNRPGKISGKATYYFGQTLTRGKVLWRVKRKTLLPWWCFWGGMGWGNLTSEVVVDSGETQIGPGGEFAIQFTPRASEGLTDIDDVRFHFDIIADVTDEGGETQTGEMTKVIGKVAVKAELSSLKKFFLEKTPLKWTIKRTDLSGVPLEGKGSWKVISLTPPKTTPTPAEIPAPPELKKLLSNKLLLADDLSRPRWDPDYQLNLTFRSWKEGNAIASGETKHDKDGVDEIKVPSLEAGVYRLRFETRDSLGVLSTEEKDFIVAGKRGQLNLPGVLLTETSTVEPGGVLRILATSGYPMQNLVLRIFRQGGVVEERELRTGKDPILLEVPVTETDRGGIGFSLALVRDYQQISLTEKVSVPWTNKLVDVEFSTFRDKLTPGNSETWAIQLKGKNGKKILPDEFEVLSYMFDKSLESFGLHLPPAPIWIYPTATKEVVPRTELGLGTLVYTNYSHIPIRNEFQGFQTDHFNFYPNYGVGGPGRRGGFSKGGRMEHAEAAMSLAADSGMAMAKRAPESPGAEPPKGTSQLRTNFSETGFWKPHLVPKNDGTMKFEFKVPDSVTSWKVFAHAVSTKLQSGSTEVEVRTAKDLMVRPYLPRFFREGDEAELRVVINNTSSGDLSGNVVFEILDEVGKKSLNGEFGLRKNELPFTVQKGSSTSVSVKVKVPPGPRSVTVRVKARAGSFSDGEQRPVPVLPGRMHLAESKFKTLKDASQVELDFPKLRRGEDSTLVHDQFVVTLDAQLFYSVLSSLPYLVNHPYQNIEQMVNSFVSSGIVSRIFDEFPEIGKMASDLSKRKTRYEAWDDKDLNRKLSLEESPWLRLSQGGTTGEDEELLSILHPDISQNTRIKFLSLLKEAQTSSGGFPWFSGGPPSPWITLHVLYGFSKALEFKVDVPKEVTVKAWSYLHERYIQEIVRDLMAHDTGWEIVTFLNFVLSQYPDSSWSGGVFSESERQAMLDFSFKHWKKHSPYLKAYLTLTLKRDKREKDAKLVWDSVMDSAITSEEEGTHWAQEDRSWLWYNDTIETHALALRTGSELGTSRKTLDGLVQWLFLNKKLNHWKSTRSTAEVLYTLTHYLRKTNQLGVRETITVKAGGEKKTFDFDPSKYSGKKNQIVYPKEKVSPKLVPVVVEKKSPGLAFASATWHYSTEELPKAPVGDFFHVSRKYFRRSSEKNRMRIDLLNEGDSVSVGDEVEVQLSLVGKHAAEYVHLRDPRPAGFEPVESTSKHKWEFGIFWFEEIRDNGTNFFFERLPQGQYNFRYRIRASVAGKFRSGPATIQPLYAPEFVGFSEGHELLIRPE